MTEDSKLVFFFSGKRYKKTRNVKRTKRLPGYFKIQVGEDTLRLWTAHTTAKELSWGSYFYRK